MTTLITFLGKGRKSGGGYETTQYQFENQLVETAYFGLALAKETNSACVRILGTSGSTWDLLLLDEFDMSKCEAEWDELELAVKNNKVTQAMLDELAQHLNQNNERKYELKIIPYGSDEKEQIDILHALTENLPNDEIILDITHGFRHLPMLSMLSLFYLRAVRQQAIKAIYYGAYEHKVSPNSPTPVIRLDGLLKLYDWIRTLEQFNKDGDYGAFATLLNAEAAPISQLFAEAAFLERIANSATANNKLTSAWQQLDNTPNNLSLAAQLFLPELRKRTEWHKGGSRPNREKQLAKDYFARRDYLRATQFAYEARVSAQVNVMKDNFNDFAKRKEADNQLVSEAENLKLSPETYGNFCTLKNLRNALAHGVVNPKHTDPASKFIQKITGDEAKLRDWLDETLQQL